MALVMRGAFLDSSVLLGGLIELGAAAKPSQALFDALAAGRLGKPRTAWHCCLELYSVATRLPEEFRLDPEDALRLLESEVFARFLVSELPRRARREFVRACAREGIRGGRLYDAHIAEIARRSGARVVVTENARHFAPLERQGIRVLTAEEALRALRG